MLIRSVAVCAALLSMPLLSIAQSSEPEVPRYYIGVSAFTNFSQRLSRKLDNSIVPPLQLTLGYQIRPRWAVQLSAAYSNSPGHSSVETAMDVDLNPIESYHNDYRNTALTFTALGRYTLTRTLSHRFQLDALGGVTMDYETYQGKGFSSDFISGERVSFDRQSHTNHKGLSVGPSFRYRLFSGLEAVGEGTVNVDLRALRNVTTSGAIGLRYRFGR
jgi:hypothetical protein